MTNKDFQKQLIALYEQLAEAKEQAEPSDSEIESIEADIIELEDLSLAELFSKDNDLSEEANEAYIYIVGEEYADSDDVSDCYAGEWVDDEDFAYNMAEDCGFEHPRDWPYNCIDWEQATRDLMYDYTESNGHYFRNN